MSNDGQRDTLNTKKKNSEAVGDHQPYPLGISDLPSSFNNMYRGYIKLWRKTKEGE